MPWRQYGSFGTVSMQNSILKRGGLAATHELHADGFGRSAIAQAVRRGLIVRVRQGWYAEPGRTDELVRAARVGGRVTCSTALELQGFWVIGDARLHVAVAAASTQLRHSRDKTRRLATDHAQVRVHWTDGAARPGSRLMVRTVDALRDYAQCASAELVGATADSIVHHKPKLHREIQRFADGSAATVRRVLAEVDGRSESGTEFLVRWRLRRRLRPSMRAQVKIEGVGRVDLLIGERLVVEVDSRRYHTDPDRFEKDRRRDAALSLRGYRVLRFSYHQVIDRWPSVDAAILAAVARGDAW